jgi:hypothetical protein
LSTRGRRRGGAVAARARGAAAARATPGSLRKPETTVLFLLNYLIESYKYIYPSLLLIIYKILPNNNNNIPNNNIDEDNWASSPKPSPGVRLLLATCRSPPLVRDAGHNTVILHDHFVVFDRHFNFLSSWGRLCIQSVPNQVAAIWN